MRLFLIISLLIPIAGLAQKKPFKEKNVRINHDGALYGTLTLPNEKSDKLCAIVFIAGSGPTDRDGNSGVALQNNSLKMLGDSLTMHGYAVLRYDKRGVGESKDAMVSEDKLRFEDYVSDAAEWVRKLKNEERYHKVFILGHSEGSLIGMLACDTANADGFISLAGPGRPADEVILEQLRRQSVAVFEEAKTLIEKIKKGEPAEIKNLALRPLFRPSVQPYMKSWMQYDPEYVITTVNKPILIVQGTTDIQVSVKDAELLQKAVPAAKMELIPGMNHILKPAPEDYGKNIQTYFDSSLPLHPGIVPAILDYLHKECSK
jgi:pimeloyl-ACP methyl ester carboxylesterase